VLHAAVSARRLSSDGGSRVLVQIPPDLRGRIGAQSNGRTVYCFEARREVPLGLIRLVALWHSSPLWVKRGSCWAAAGGCGHSTRLISIPRHVNHPAVSTASSRSAC
jgi:hypothetical protein